MRRTPERLWTRAFCSLCLLLASFTPALGADDYQQADAAREFGGVLVPIETPKGRFRVWTQRHGSHPTKKVLLLHGGPGDTHEYFEVFERHFPEAGIEFYYYDQLGSHYSDQPDEPELWDLERFVEEVEQVRRALGLEPEAFFLLGQSWGGLLAIEYALRYPDRLKGLIISNMMASIPAYNAYAESMLKPNIDPAALAEIERIEAEEDYANPRYMQLLVEHYYVRHILRMPAEKWPDAVKRAFQHTNVDIYIPMQGPSEMGASGALAHWDRTADLASISIPTLVIGARHDTMDPRHMEWMAGAVEKGRYLHCPNGSHLAQYDDENAYFRGLIRFIEDVDAGRF